MEKIKFVMTDTDTQVSDACRRALEGKGVSVTVCEKNGTKALDAGNPPAGRASGCFYA